MIRNTIEMAALHPFAISEDRKSRRLFGGKPYVQIDRTAYPIESAKSAYSGHNVH
jgi:hypothetical protein